MARDTDHPLPAREAFRRYWRYLILIALNPAVAQVVIRHYASHWDGWDLLFTGYFFASVVPPIWLVATRKVRYSFWLVTIGVLFVSGFVTMLVVSLASAVIA